MKREIEYIQKQLAKAQMAKKHLPVNAPKEQRENPVSYTHLDVYKRQQYGRADQYGCSAHGDSGG